MLESSLFFVLRFIIPQVSGNINFQQSKHGNYLICINVMRLRYNGLTLDHHADSKTWHCYLARNFQYLVIHLFVNALVHNAKKIFSFHSSVHSYQIEMRLYFKASKNTYFSTLTSKKPSQNVWSKHKVVSILKYISIYINRNHIHHY